MVLMKVRSIKHVFVCSLRVNM